MKIVKSAYRGGPKPVYVRMPRWTVWKRASAAPTTLLGQLAPTTGCDRATRRV